MEEMENGKRYSAESKGYNDKIYEVRFLPVMERPEYQEGETIWITAPFQELYLEKLKKEMAEKDFEKYINNGLIRVTYDGSHLMLIAKSEIYRTMLTGPFFNVICKAFDVGNFRVVSQVNGY